LGLAVARAHVADAVEASLEPLRALAVGGAERATLVDVAVAVVVDAIAADLGRTGVQLRIVVAAVVAGLAVAGEAGTEAVAVAVADRDAELAAVAEREALAHHARFGGAAAEAAGGGAAAAAAGDTGAVAAALAGAAVGVLRAA